jgi:hypothetical protein
MQLNNYIKGNLWGSFGGLGDLNKKASNVGVSLNILYELCQILT